MHIFAPVSALICESVPQVRRHAVVLLTQLVLEDYVKLRGPLFYHLVCALADPDDGVRQSAEHAVLAALAQRSKGLLHAKFVEVVLVLTGCVSQPAFAHLLEASASGSASGAEVPSTDLDPACATAMQVRSPALRRQVYNTLLGAMPDEQRLTVYAKLTSDILGAVAEGSLPLSAPGAGSGGSPSLGSTELLLSEVLTLLSTAPLRVSTKKCAAVAADADDDDGGAEAGAESALHASIAAAKSRLVSKLMKRQVAEQVLPVVLGLRQVLQAARSSAMGALLGYIKTLLEDYGDEIHGAEKHADALLDGPPYGLLMSRRCFGR